MQIYQVYQESCDRAGLVDFAEILLRAHELFLNKEHILAHYQDRFRNILVDEFQDTNAIQYAWIRVLAGKSANVMIVGDDDQSIYGWRGAQVENLHKFLQDFPNAETIRLEQNYRSSGNILKASNELIANNPDRLGKQLWTEDVDGEPISVYCAFNEMDEARFIIGRIGDWQDKGAVSVTAPSSIAVMLNHGYWKRPCCTRGWPIASMAACASSSVRRSRMPWDTCV